MATILETGNHISRLGTGARRREYAVKLITEIRKAAAGDAPYRPTHFPDKVIFLSWMDKFHEYAMRNKSDKKTTEGVSLSDMCIIKEWERTVKQNSARIVAIWSLDVDLSAYRHVP